MTNTIDSTAALVAAAMAQAKKSQVDIHEQTGIARSSLQRKLAGLSKFTIDELYVIAKALGIKTKQLIPKELLNDEAEEPDEADEAA